MPSIIKLRLDDYPNLASLIFGQESSLTMKVRTGLTQKINYGGEERDEIELIIDSIDIGEPTKKLSPQEVLLAGIARNTALTALNTGSVNTPIG